MDNTCYLIFCVRLLNEAQGSLLDDEQLVNTLQTSKKTSEEVTEQLQVSEQTEAKIDAAREVRASLLAHCTIWPDPSENIKALSCNILVKTFKALSYNSCIFWWDIEDRKQVRFKYP